MAQAGASTTRNGARKTQDKTSRTTQITSTTTRRQTTRAAEATAGASAVAPAKTATTRKADTAVGAKTAGNGAKRPAVQTKPGAAAGQAITPEMRQQMISETAYFLAAERGFEPGSEEQDWLRAEAEVDRLLGA